MGLFTFKLFSFKRKPEEGLNALTFLTAVRLVIDGNKRHLDQDLIIDTPTGCQFTKKPTTVGFFLCLTEIMYLH